MNRFPAFRPQLFAAVSLLMVFTIDMLTPLGVAIGVLYVAAFFCVIKTSTRTILLYASISTALVIFKLLLFEIPDPGWITYLNRAISVLAIVVVAAFSVRQRNLNEKMEEARELYIQTVRRKNHKLQTYRKSLNLYLLMSVIDRRGYITYVNPSFCTLSGYASNELVGQRYDFLFDEESRKTQGPQIMPTLESGLSWRGEIKNMAGDGSFFWCDMVIMPVKDHDTGETEYFSISMPITERKELEAEQAESLQTFEMIMWKVSHKLRAPVATCQGIAHLLERETSAGRTELQENALLNRRTCTRELEEFSREMVDMIRAVSVRRPD